PARSHTASKRSEWLLHNHLQGEVDLYRQLQLEAAAALLQTDAGKFLDLGEAIAEPGDGKVEILGCPVQVAVVIQVGFQCQNQIPLVILVIIDQPADGFATKINQLFLVRSLEKKDDGLQLFKGCHGIVEGIGQLQKFGDPQGILITLAQLDQGVNLPSGADIEVMGPKFPFEKFLQLGGIFLDIHFSVAASARKDDHDGIPFQKGVEFGTLQEDVIESVFQLLFGINLYGQYMGLGVDVNFQVVGPLLQENFVIFSVQDLLKKVLLHFPNGLGDGTLVKHLYGEDAD